MARVARLRRKNEHEHNRRHRRVDPPRLEVSAAHPPALLNSFGVHRKRSGRASSSAHDVAMQLRGLRSRRRRYGAPSRVVARVIGRRARRSVGGRSAYQFRSRETPRLICLTIPLKRQNIDSCCSLEDETDLFPDDRRSNSAALDRALDSLERGHGWDRRRDFALVNRTAGTSGSPRAENGRTMSATAACENLETARIRPAGVMEQECVIVLTPLVDGSSSVMLPVGGEEVKLTPANFGTGVVTSDQDHSSSSAKETIPLRAAYVASLASGESKDHAEIKARHLRTLYAAGHLFYRRQFPYAQPFDAESSSFAAITIKMART